MIEQPPLPPEPEEAPEEAASPDIDSPEDASFEDVDVTPGEGVSNLPVPVRRGATDLIRLGAVEARENWLSLREGAAGRWETMLCHLQSVREAYIYEKRKPFEAERRAQELAFLPPALEVTETPASAAGRWLALAISAFFIIASVWAAFGEIDIIATAQGKIIPAGRVQVIQPLESNTIRAIRVKDGDAVRAGDVLVELDPTQARADRVRLSEELIATRVDEARLEALLADDPDAAFVPPAGAPADLVGTARSFLASRHLEHQARMANLDAEYARKQAEIGAIKAEIARLETVIPKIRERVKSRRALVKKKYAARMQLLELEEELADKTGRLRVERERIKEAKAALAAALSRRRQAKAEFHAGTHGELAETRRRRAGLEQELVKAQKRERGATLRAPIDGVVQELAVHTVGGVVTPAQELMVVVPADAELEIEAMVLNKDIGFVKNGDAAEIKVEAFPFTKFGTIDGRVVNVSRDAVEDENLGPVYPARVAMARTVIDAKEGPVDLTPGMAVTAEVKTGKRKLIEYLLAPLQRYKAESMHER